MTDVVLTALQLPDFGMPTVEPRIPAGVFQARCAAALERAASAGFDVLVVYGDREHFANIAYLTNYDPRFEEALLILRAGHKPTLLVGNEGWSYANIVPYEINVILYQSFSLLAQPRGDSLSLAEIFDLCGIGADTRVGVAGWKYFDERKTDTPDSWLEVPSYLVDTLRQLTGDSSCVSNATSLFMNPVDGLRIINEVDQLAAFEFAACHSSQSVRNVIFGLKPGMTEYETVRLMQLNGIPHSVTLMLSSGERTSLGLASPSSRVIQQGDPFVTAFGLWGALNCRAGFVVKDADQLPENIHDYVDKLVVPYFRAVAEWYETVGIGVTGGDLFA
ncbi:MAG: hypothetical protein H7175_26255, partial [Burkholderiales bacterium]|nr:hypothetical protein [Anaerolineae bacterium]